MKKLAELAKWFFYITTCVLIVCAVNLQISGRDLITANVLWQILGSGFLTSLVTVFLRPGEHDSGRQMFIKMILHYIALCIVMMLCGYWFGWMDLTSAGIIMMVVSVAAVYAMVFFSSLWIDMRRADEINQKLKEKYNDKE